MTDRETTQVKSGAWRRGGEVGVQVGAMGCNDSGSSRRARPVPPRVAGSPFEVPLPVVEGEWVLLSDSLERAARDFGKVEYRRPAVVLLPASTEDICVAIRFARAHGIAVAARGDAHSAGGQMLVEGGMVIDMTQLCRVHELTPERIVVDAGISWRALLERTLALGSTPPVLTDWVDVTVGGTLSMGGLGFSSFWRGTQMDHVLELEVITGTGERVVCSPSVRPDLFDGVRGTHGQMALIVRATIPLEPAPETISVTQAAYGDADLLMKDLRGALTARHADYVHALATPRTMEALTTRLNSSEPMCVDEARAVDALSSDGGAWVYQLELATPVVSGQRGRDAIEMSPGALPGLRDTWEMPFRDFVLRIPPLIAEEARRGAAPHPELILWVPDQATQPLLVDAFEELDPVEDIGEGPVLIFALRKSVVTAPFYALPEVGDLCFFFGLLRRAEPGTEARVRELRQDNERRYQAALEYGAGRYVCDTPPTERSEAEKFWPRHYGSSWGEMCERKRSHDPASLFRSTWGAYVAVEASR